MILLKAQNVKHLVTHLVTHFVSELAESGASLKTDQQVLGVVVTSLKYTIGSGQAGKDGK